MFRQVHEKGQPWAYLLRQMLVIGEEFQKIMIYLDFENYFDRGYSNGKELSGGLTIPNLSYMTKSQARSWVS